MNWDIQDSNSRSSEINAGGSWENASVHTTPELGTDAVGVQARIAGFWIQEQCNHSMIYRERRKITGKKESKKRGEWGGNAGIIVDEGWMRRQKRERDKPRWDGCPGSPEASPVHIR